MREKKIFSALDCFAIVGLSFFSLFTRLWMIYHPSTVVFDEVHFGNFSNWYIRKEFHFDIHPPLGKMIMAMIAKTTQYKGDIEYGNKLGMEYEINELFYVSQRMTPAIFSAMTSPLIFAACRCLSLSTFSSFCAGFILSTDMSIIVEGKFILSDGMLHFFTTLHIFALCLFLNDNLEERAIFAGITLGAAAACKYTALGLFVVDGITQIIWIFMKKPSFRNIIIRGSNFLIPSIIVFFGAWILHFVITPYEGYNSDYMIHEHQSSLLPKNKVNSSYMGNRLIGSSLYQRIVYWNVIMNRINMRSDIPHPFESKPIYWPFLLDKYVGFYRQDDQEIHCLGTPAVYWLSSISIILSFLLFWLIDWRNALLLWGWAVSYFPFVLVPRTMFMYHYIVPLMFAIMNMIVLCDNCLNQHKETIITLITLTCFICYAFFYPWIYGIDCPKCADSRLWLDRWNKGVPLPVYTDGLSLFNTTHIMMDLPK